MGNITLSSRMRCFIWSIPEYNLVCGKHMKWVQTHSTFQYASLRQIVLIEMISKLEWFVSHWWFIAINFGWKVSSTAAGPLLRWIINVNHIASHCRSSSTSISVQLKVQVDTVPYMSCENVWFIWFICKTGKCEQGLSAAYQLLQISFSFHSIANYSQREQ